MDETYLEQEIQSLMEEAHNDALTIKNLEYENQTLREQLAVSLEANAEWEKVCAAIQEEMRRLGRDEQQGSGGEYRSIMWPEDLGAEVEGWCGEWLNQGDILVDVNWQGVVVRSVGGARSIYTKARIFDTTLRTKRLDEVRRDVGGM